MARITRYQENAPRFSALPSGGGPSPSIDVTGGGVLSRIREQHMQERERATLQRAQERGLLTQTEEGTARERVAAPDNWAARYQRSFDEQARTVQSAQLKQDADRNRFRLAIEHQNDPDGFARAWDAYMQGMVGELEQSDPAAAAQAQLSLDDAGLQQYQRLEEQRMTRERAAQATEHMEGLQGSLVEYRNALINTGDEETWLESVDSLEAQMQDAVATGLIEPGRAADFARQQRTILTEEFARGSFAASLRDEDYLSAFAVIDALHQGQWFEDNRDARRVAASLQQQLNGLTGGDNTGITQSVRQLQRMHASILRGDDQYTEVDMQPLVERITANGTESQAQTAVELGTSAAFRLHIEPSLRQIPLGQLTDQNINDVMRELAPSDVHLSPERANELRDIMTQRRQKLEDGAASGDLAGAASAPLRPNEYDPVQDPGAFQRFQQDTMQVRLDTARAYGMPPEAVFPYGHETLQEFNNLFRQQYEMGDFDGMTNTVALFTQGAQNEWEAMAFANRLPEDAAAMRTAVQLASMGMDEDAQTVLQLAVAGEDVDATQMRHHFGRSASDDLDRYSDAIAAMTQGEAGRVGDVSQFVQNLYAGVQADLMNRGQDSHRAVRREVDRLLAPFSDSVQFDNGFKLPSRMLDSHPLGARVVQAEINSVLRDPARLGLDDPSQTENWRNVAPVPFASGAIAFQDRRTGRLVFDPETDDVLMLFSEDILGTPEGQAAMQEMRTVGEITMDALQEGGEFAGEFARGIGTINASQRAKIASGVLGANEGLVDRISIAARAVPVDVHAGNRETGSFGLPLDIEDRIDRSDVIRSYNRWAQGMLGRGFVESDASLLGETLAPFALAAYINDLEAQYGEMGEQAVAAAFWAGAEVLDGLIEQHGDAALNHLPVNVQKLMQHTFSPRQAHPPVPQLEPRLRDQRLRRLKE